MKIDADYGLTVTKEGYALVQWHDADNGDLQQAELDPESADVKEAIALIRKIIWGA